MFFLKNNTIALIALVLIVVSISSFFIYQKNIIYITGFAGSGEGSTAFNLTEESSVKITGSIDFGTGRVSPNASYAILDSELGAAYPYDYVAFWKFDAVNGSDLTFAPDEAGLRNGTVRNATIATGISGQAYSFNGKNGAINLGGDQSAFKATSRTISFWAKPVLSPNHYHGTFAQYNGFFTIYFAPSTNRVYVTWLNSTGGQKMEEIGPTNSVTYGNWSHYAVVFNVAGSTVNISIYKNGSAIGSYQDSEGQGNYVANKNFVIGAYANGTDVFNGSLDQVFFYNRTLTNAEIMSIYQFDGNWSGSINGTWVFPRGYLNVENDGTINISINASADKNAGQFIGGTNPSFMAKGVVNEANACTGMVTSYTEVSNSTDAPLTLCPLLQFSNDRDIFNMPVRLVIPSDVGSGTKNATITLSATKV